MKTCSTHNDDGKQAFHNTKCVSALLNHMTTDSNIMRRYEVSSGVPTTESSLFPSSSTSCFPGRQSPLISGGQMEESPLPSTVRDSNDTSWTSSLMSTSSDRSRHCLTSMDSTQFILSITLLWISSCAIMSTFSKMTLDYARKLLEQENQNDPAVAPLQRLGGSSMIKRKMRLEEVRLTKR